MRGPSMRCKFDSCEIGVFSKLTNAYCLIPFEDWENNGCSKLKEVLGDVIPVVKASIAGTTTIGRLCAGNSRGLLLSHDASSEELQHLRNSLPDTVIVERVEERLAALGNCISCNDHVALVDPGLRKETKEFIADILGVEVFDWTVAGDEAVGCYATFSNTCGLVHPRSSIGDDEAAGCYVAFSNTGGLVHPRASIQDLDNLSTKLGVPLAAGTVNGGRDKIATGLIVNDWMAFCGWNTTAAEQSVIESVLGLEVVPLAMD